MDLDLDDYQILDFVVNDKWDFQSLRFAFDHCFNSPIIKSDSIDSNSNSNCKFPILNNNKISFAVYRFLISKNIKTFSWELWHRI